VIRSLRGRPGVALGKSQAGDCRGILILALIVLGASVLASTMGWLAHGEVVVFPALTLAVYVLYRAFRNHLNLPTGDRQRQEALDLLDQGVCILDEDRRVTVWNDALQRIVGCSEDAAIGRFLVDVVPASVKTELSRLVDTAVAGGGSQVLERISLPSAAGARVLKVRVVPNADGAMVLWLDVSEQARAEQVLQRSEERFAAVAAGANDALWEWNLRSHSISFSNRWAAALGMPDSACKGRPETAWFDRVHTDDIATLKKAFEVLLSGQADHIHHEHRVRHEDGTYRWMLCRGVTVPGRNGRPRLIAGSLTDTTERVDARERLRNAGFRDPLTGLSNRAVFVRRLGQRLQQFKQQRERRFAVLYLDLDRFKVVNDSLGHLVGDELLNAVSRRLESCLREGDALARLGGDEFAILLNEIGDETQANAIAFRIQDVLSGPFSISSRDVFTSASIGIAFSAAEYNNPEEVMRDADTAMYYAKEHGRARHELFDADMHARALDRLSLEQDLRRAVKSNEFEVHYQPIVSLPSGRCAGFEALVRWSRNGKAISPVQFVPMAEELGLIEPLGTWVLREACRAFSGWQRRFPTNALECITVNVSPRQLGQQNFPRIVEQALQDAGMRPDWLRLEITETALMHGPYETAAILSELRNLGVKIYLDDFGTGYSSLSHLHSLPVDALKIDRSFVRGLLLPDRPALVESIMALARTLDTGVVAEGVESDVQSLKLEQLGCRYAQGYFFSPPISTVSVEALLSACEPLGRNAIDHSQRRSFVDREPELYLQPVSFEWVDARTKQSTT
jgi:diguanylate cyclase (GGDEF)-like protein/PAS domain S-box-containing protein